ncbi:MAG: hypothetical protein KA713_15875 [Chryseotalea sp. WA131a]|jgi:hypothetical protein|nr:MAG: hypothetical protein KA713_15875 [Chryseotalea sp. WA131a]
MKKLSVLFVVVVICSAFTSSAVGSTTKELTSSIPAEEALYCSFTHLKETYTCWFCDCGALVDKVLYMK